MNEHKQPWTNTFNDVIDQITNNNKQAWELNFYEEKNNTANYVSLTCGNEIIISGCGCCHGAYTNNLKLLKIAAAAPDLLEALKLFCTMYERTTGLPTPSQALRAIKKAEGGV